MLKHLMKFSEFHLDKRLHAMDTLLCSACCKLQAWITRMVQAINLACLS